MQVHINQSKMNILKSESKTRKEKKELAPYYRLPELCCLATSNEQKDSHVYSMVLIFFIISDILIEVLLCFCGQLLISWSNLLLYDSTIVPSWIIFLKN